MNFLSSPTLRLLNSSTLVAFSGALRLHIAFLLAGIEPMIKIDIAGGLIIYSTYTLDRALDSEEDAINRGELIGSKKHVAIAACIIAFLAGTLILTSESIFFASFFPFIVGYLYSKGIKIGRFKLKLKGSAGGKNLVVALTWGGTIAIIVSKWTDSIFTIVSIFLFYAIKLFTNSILYDIRDIKGDMAAGIKTLPVCMGKNRIKKILMIICLLLHSVMFLSIMMNFIRPETVILSYSFLVGILCLSFYFSAFEGKGSGIKSYSRELMIDGESTIALVLRDIL